MARRSIGVGLVVLAACTLCSGGGRARVTDGSGAGMKAYIDPRTGRLASAPVVPETARPLPAPVPHLAEEPAPGGGMMVHLNGHFMSNLVATVNPDGSVRMDCVTGDGPHAHDAE